MLVQITRTIPIYRSPEDTGVFVQWVVQDSPSALITFNIERCTSDHGPFETVIAGLTGYHFFDNLRAVPAAPVGDTRENLNFLSLIRSLYYKITAVAATGETASHTVEVEATLPKRQSLLQRKAQRDLAITFKFNAVPAYVLKRKHWGLRCKKCFDLLTKKVTNSKCTTCYGTGFDGGYETPVLIKGRFSPPNDSTTMTPQGLADITKIKFVCSDHPRLDPYDLIVDKYQNQRYLVEQHAATELRRNAVHQSLVLSELSRDSIEYRLLVNDDIQPLVY